MCLCVRWSLLMAMLGCVIGFVGCEDLESRPYHWLRADYVLPTLFLVMKDKGTKTSRIMVEPHLIDGEFCKAWILYFRRSGHPVVTVS